MSNGETLRTMNEAIAGVAAEAEREKARLRKRIEKLTNLVNTLCAALTSYGYGDVAAMARGDLAQIIGKPPKA